MHVDQIFSKWNLLSKGTSQRDPDLVSLCTQIWTGPVPCAKRERSAPSRLWATPQDQTRPSTLLQSGIKIGYQYSWHSNSTLKVLFSQPSTKSASRYINFSTLDHIIVIKRVCYAAFRLGQILSS